jgi:hypothetical protein
MHGGPKVITQTLAIAAAGAIAWGLLQTHRLGESRLELAQLREENAYAVSAAYRENSREISRLTTLNQEIQRAYNENLAALDQHQLDRARTERVRQQQRQDIAAAAQRAPARACGEYAQAAERDLEFAEAERSRFGQEAVRASAAAHALNDTLTGRRQALDDKRKALKEK